MVMTGAFSRRLHASAARLLLATLVALAGLPVFAKDEAHPTGHERPWSFAPLTEHAPPVGEEKNWAQTRIDRFLLADMRAAGLEPAPPAESRMLVRRLYFDLLGLPPTTEAVEAFADAAARDRPAAVRDLVEELLQSPHYGERWARHWLDLARYTDVTASWLDSTASAWLYRDWVVRSLNEDLPYDEFVKRQLAADLLPGLSPEENAALGFLGLSPTYWKELQLPPEIIKGTVADEWEEHVDALGRTFLGLTLGCARCHDHKTDPVTARDYYAIAGVFASVKFADRPTISEDLWAPVAKARAEVAKLEAEQAALKKKKPTPEDIEARLAKLSEKIAAIQKATPHYHVPTANGIVDAALYVKPKDDGKHGTKLEYVDGKARDLEMHMRGDPNVVGETVPRGFLSAFPADDGKPRRFQRGSGRLELAEAIVEEGAPLAARVMVNRVWRQHFGHGLVETPSEFGNAGDEPTHPDLLDDLAARFVANGWSIKWLHREILNSAAWQQSSIAPESEARDPGNRHYARMSRRRLEIEAWRDAMLAVTGQLDRTIGGNAIDLASETNHRRTLYGKIHRRDLDQMLRLHDFPDPTAHSPKRPETTTPLQLLFTLNGPFIRQQAEALGKSLAEQPSAPVEARVESAYDRLFQRPPTTRERELGVAFLGGSPDLGAWTEYAQALLGSNEFLFVD